jgi:hypothetical protein
LIQVKYTPEFTGSFEIWNRSVRDPLIWAGFPDAWRNSRRCRNRLNCRGESARYGGEYDGKVCSHSRHPHYDNDSDQGGNEPLLDRRNAALELRSKPSDKCHDEVAHSICPLLSRIEY